MNVLIIGNSHAGSLKRISASVLQNENLDLNIHFAAARGNLFQDLEVNEGIIESKNQLVIESLRYTYGKSHLDLKKVSPKIILCYGMHLSIKFYWWSMSQKGAFYSEKVKYQALADLYDTYGFSLAKKIQKATNTKVFISEPISALEINKEKQQYMNEREQKTKFQDSLNFVQNFFFDSFNVEYFLQPVETIEFSGNVRTKKIYAKNSVKFDVGDEHDGTLHEDGEIGHMNDDFGYIFLKNFLLYAIKNI